MLCSAGLEGGLRRLMIGRPFSDEMFDCLARVDGRLCGHLTSAPGARQRWRVLETTKAGLGRGEVIP